MTKFVSLASRFGQIAFALGLCLFALRILSYHLGLVTYPFPSSFREGAMMTTTDALVRGMNPYDMSLQPQFMNPYGIIYPLLIWPWAKIFGTTMFIHRIATAVSIMAICTLVFFILKRMSVPILLNIWAIVMLYASLIFPGTSTPTIDPGATATFFMLLTVFIPWFCEYSTGSLTASLLLGLLSFYTKPYAVIGTIVMASYLFLFVSKKKGLCYGGAWLLLLTASVLLVNRLLPAYFDNCFFASFNMAHEWSSMERLIMQTHWYGSLYMWTLILMGIFAALSLRGSEATEAISFKTVSLPLYAGAWSAFVLYISLGRHTGATLWYFFQLLSPYLLITAAWLFNRYAFWPLAIPFLLLNLFTLTADEDYQLFNKNTSSWTDVNVLLDHYQHVLGAPAIVPLLVQQNREVFDNGQSEYFLPGGRRMGWTSRFLQDDQRVFLQEILFFNKIKSRVENKEFDLILLQPNLLPLGIGDDIRKYYKFEGQVVVYPPQDRKPYGITVWRPL
jgi:hypothetical protein